MVNDLKYIRAAAGRQLPFAIGTVVVLMALVVALIYVIPTKHKAKARLLVEANAVSQKAQVANDALTDAAHLQNIENRLLTQSRLSTLIDALGVHMSADQLQAATTFDAVSGRGKATTLTISVKAQDAQFATSATNLLAEEVIAEHRAIRTERAEAALQFFRGEVAENKARMDGKLAALLDFKTASAGALPADLQPHLDQRAALLARMVTPAATLPKSVEHRKILTQIAAARTIYSDQHPKVQLLLAKLDKLVPTTPIMTELDPVLPIELGKIDALIAAIPGNELRLNALSRDHDLAVQQYESAIGRLEAAAIEERIALRSNGDRLTIVERATLPDFTGTPKQTILLALGGLFALLTATALAVFRAKIDPTLRRPRDLEMGLGLAAYAVIPTLQTHPEQVTL